ncbi:MAG: SUMF1/EgtB/PvdO family nonheme iron enzyme [Prevotella sp.]|nr:SUMF1/EgtB/PvdO family nonheme iron enzyme [Prevotella sp.]
MDHDVFISYSSQDMKAAQAICHVLEQNEIRCWMAPRNIPPGSDYGDVIDDAIKSCKVVVVIFSETAAESQWVKGELNIAFEEQKTIIPFRLDNTPLKGQNRVMLNKTHWIDAYPDYKIKFNDLVTAVALSVGKEVISGPPPLPPKTTDYKKPIIIGVISILIIAAISFIYPLIAKQMHSFTYDKQGLHVKIKGLTTPQEEAIATLLDNMVLVDGGIFAMGNTEEMADYLTEQDSLSNTIHEVELDKFYICKYEVTQKQWRAFFPTEGKCIADGEDTAMDMLSWEDAKAFADTLSTISGLRFALPTEAQWEFAARGGTKTHHYIFSGNDDATEVGWTSFEELTSAHEVGGKRYNELDLYDMTGNVMEWCSDYFDLYSSEKVVNPQGPSKGVNRVLRGGDFRIENLYDMKTATRYFDSPFVNRRGAGLRLVINIEK